ncbi:MAG: error-prone DNA polymerase [Myxococcales bacterium]|nr:error-prone DNA polymerase [Myxococcales bacterium]MCB9520415.1 error-prone DNA polymerase [Myxococcales bacterium]MCB9530319.1 error-prone DNA polymerase [Myxococcales bacterium]MCB9534151.1 error-prone DNA polymerase [Myxococcales bacterium]
MTRAGGYAALWCRSNYSFLEGASHPDELVEQASALGIGAIALTDRDGVYGAVRAHVAAARLGVKLIHGATVTVGDAQARALENGEVGRVADGTSVVLLAMDRVGYGNLCGLITCGRRRAPKGSAAVTWAELASHAGGLIALWGGEGSAIAASEWDATRGERLKEAFADRLYVLVTRHRAAPEVEVEARVRSRAAGLGAPIVAGVEVLYHERARRDLHDVLTCIRHGVTLADAGRRLRPNAEHDLKAPVGFAELFADDAAAVARTQEVASRCTFTLDEIRYRYPSERLPSGLTSAEWLRSLTERGAFERYGSGSPPAVREQLQRELELIEELDYCGYFLTMYEIVRFCREHGILCQGRGSAANSAVCYCLGITAVDPVRMGLLFERFLSRERAEPPDIDLDIGHERREEVIQHVYEKYGRAHAAMVANVIRYRPKSAVRDIGKALGVPLTALDRLARLVGHHEAPSGEVFATAGLRPDVPVNAHLLRLSSELLDFPRHLSIHPGGFLLGHDPVHTLVPIENATMADRTVIQWDKDDVEALGLFKVDLLGLGALTHLDRTFSLLRDRRGVELDLAGIPPDDPDTYDGICAGDTVGVFQIESRAQMAMLPRLRPRTFYDLVIEVSIVRPGPIAGDMVHPYLRRRHGREEVTYPHPSLVSVLEKTLGVPLFQEQVMKLAMVAADYTPGEADQLRRDMAAWRSRGKMDQHHTRLTSRMIAKGIEPEFAERVFEQIRGFGEYGFPESHAASFALISYATAYLRTHYLPEFTCALLNSLPMGFYSAATVLDDAKRHGLTVLPIDARTSGWECSLVDDDGGEHPSALRLGFRFLKGFAAADWERLRHARDARDFASVDDLVARTGLNERALRMLAESGALGQLGGDRRGAVWDVLGALSTRGQALDLQEADGTPGFEELSPLETITWDYRTTSLSPRGHPLSAVRAVLEDAGLPDAEGIAALRSGARTKYAGLVICRQRPGAAGGVVFMTLEDETGFVNVVVWQKVWEKFSLLARTTSFLGVSGKVQVEDGVVHLVAESLWVPRLDASLVTAQSRDFH